MANKRQPGYYWVRVKGGWVVCEYFGHIHEDSFCWLYDGETQQEEYFEEIDERQIVRHLPTESKIIQVELGFGINAGIKDLTKAAGLNTPRNYFDSTH